MWWMTWRAPVHYVVDDVASFAPVHYVVDDVASTTFLMWRPAPLPCLAAQVAEQDVKAAG